MIMDDILTRWQRLVSLTSKIPTVRIVKGLVGYLAPKTQEGLEKIGPFWAARGKDIQELLGVSTDYWLNSTAELLTGFGVPADQANRVARTLSKMVPDVPVLKQLLLMMYPLTFALTVFPKAFSSVGDVMDKQFRRDLRPQVGNLADLLTTRWRYEDEISFQELLPETGLSPEWAAQITAATQFWPEVSMFQELRRRGLITDAELHEWLDKSGVKDGRIEKQLIQTMWNVPPLNVVLEMYRRSNRDERLILPYMEKVSGMYHR
ncbi:hypothetical protein ES705_45354 [subsurface metagenome]